MINYTIISMLKKELTTNALKQPLNAKKKSTVPIVTPL